MNLCKTTQMLNSKKNTTTKSPSPLFFSSNVSKGLWCKQDYTCQSVLILENDRETQFPILVFFTFTFFIIC